MGTRRARRGLAADIGAICLGDGWVRFRVWAPGCRRVEVEIVHPESRRVALRPTAGGYFAASLQGQAGLRYFYILDGQARRPDPASRALPEGVHGPSEAVDTTAFAWTDAGWRGMPLRDMVIYELHIGTFTPEGTFEAVIPRLPQLRDLGVTAVELMPVASFPGWRNWGYDGVGLFAPQRTYGGPAGLRRLVDACHANGLAVVLDVVYNHLGPEGSYLAEFGPYFTDRYTTPWGQAINYDGEDSRGARDFVIANALHWIREYHIDSLRLDAIHGIFDGSPVHILRELNDAVQRLARRLGRAVPVVAESDLNDRRVIDPVRKGGYGLSGQWSDDFHHCIHTLLTGERSGYYADFGSLRQLAKAYTDGFVYDGQHSTFRGRPHGTPTGDVPAERFVVCAQNHDQVGNRAQGERLQSLVDFEALKLAASAVLVSPFVPLLFMGQEYGERAPFLFFSDFGDPGLQAAVSRGRREEFAAFGWTGEVPDPQNPSSFARSKLNWSLRTEYPYRWLFEFYRTLLSLRRQYPVLGIGGKRRLQVREADDRTLLVFRRGENGTAALAVLRFAPEGRAVRLRVPPGPWRRLADSSEERFGGLGAKSPVLIPMPRGGWAEVEIGPYAAVIYLREAVATATVQAQIIESVAPDAAVPSAA
ncbi:MAG: malto-oligosyltrehalose trehalohydrolase [candidate division NC10 bacterium]|nr:malto-oligosyltrehalose trehalohydrolase [candidate division NC10 bacterium]